MSLPGRAVEWLAISTVVGIGLAAAFYLAPGPAPVPRAVAATPGPAEASEPPLAPDAVAAPDRLMVVRERRQAAPQAQLAQEPAAPSYVPSSGKTAALAAARGPRLKPTQPVVGLDNAQHTAAFISNAPQQTYQAPAAAETYQAPSSSRGSGSTVAQASAVRYGVSDRSEIMGRGAGPVYNLRASRSSRSSGAAAAAAPAPQQPIVEDPE